MAGKQIDLKIEGMHCAACVTRIERQLRKVDGVTDAAVNLATNRARVSVAGSAGVADLVSAVERAGYGASAVDSDGRADDTEPAARAGRELVAAALLAAPVLVVGMAWTQRPVAVDWALAIVSAVVVFGFGRQFFTGALAALRTGAATMDTLIALGSSAAWGFSLVQLLAAKSPQTYFETASTIVTLILMGRWLEARAKRAAGDSVRALVQLAPATARRIAPDGGEADVAISAIAVGDTVRIRPGDRITVDGVVIEGESEIDESVVTGESVPEVKRAGDRVLSGSVNTIGALKVRVEAAGERAFLGQMIRAVEDAQASKAPVQRLADRISAVFVPVVLVIAAATFVGWHFVRHADMAASITNAVAVLVIACPCALGLATPTAIIVASGTAARNGFLIRNADVLERTQRINRVLFDKTGTLTTGRPHVETIEAFGVHTHADVIALALSAEQHSEHPLARAIAERAAQLGAAPQPSTGFLAVPGQGVIANIGEHAVVVGTGKLLVDNGIEIAAEVQRRVDELSALPGAVVLVGNDGEAVGAIAIADTVRPEAEEAVAALKRMRIDVGMLTGDSEAAARPLAHLLGIEEVHAGIKPADKLKLVKPNARKARGTAMVGDGINDAPALAAAGIGIAMGKGTGAAIEAADITLLRDDLRCVPAAIQLARRTMGVIRGNLFWAFAFNAIGIPLAGTGHLSPMIAALAMAMSSVTVVGNSLRLRTPPPLTRRLP